MDVLLSTLQSRARLLSEKIVALVGAIVVIGLFIALLGGIAGEASAKIDVDVTGALLTGLNVSLLALFFAGMALFLSQLLRSRAAAAGLTGAVLTLSIVFDATGRSVDNTAWLQHLSPLYYYNLSKPLLPFYTAMHGVNAGAMVLLLVLDVVLLTASVLLFASRNIGEAALPSWSRKVASTHSEGIGQVLKQAQRNVFVRTIGLRALRASTAGAFWWLAGLSLWAMWGTSIARSTEEPLKKIYAGSPLIAKLFGGQDMGTNAAFLQLVVFLFIQIAIVIFALTLALSWANDLDNGRLELLLSTPRSRTRMMLERFGALLMPVVVAPLVIWLSVLVGAGFTDLSVDAGRVAAASFGMLPLELIVMSLVYMLAGRLRSGAVLGILSGFIALSFFAEFLHTILNLPDWLLSLSIFHQYGSPITDGLKWGPFLTMIGIALLLLLLGIVQFNHGDVERGA
ncbi:MAG: hypothetical protein NVSMB33_15090 [Ktedonobacteraceae bacterium]